MEDDQENLVFLRKVMGCGQLEEKRWLSSGNHVSRTRYQCL